MNDSDISKAMLVAYSVLLGELDRQGAVDRAAVVRQLSNRASRLSENPEHFRAAQIVEALIAAIEGGKSSNNQH